MRGLRGSFAAVALALFAAPAAGQNNPIKLGVLTDLAGAYADFGGPGSVEAAQMAAEDFGGKVLGRPIVVISGDHLNKPDVGVGLARRWFETEGVHVILDLPNSGVALAVQDIGAQLKKIVITSGAVSMDLTGKKCSPTGFHWTTDSYALSRGATRAVVKQGFDTWFYLTVNLGGGTSLEADSEAAMTPLGGKVLGRVRHPVNTSDFSSYLLQAQSSKAKVVAFANGGGDTVNAIKGANEFGLVKAGQKLVALYFNVGDVKSLGLQVAQGLTFMEAFYWDMDDQTRAFSKRFYERRKAMPSSYQAGVYSAVAHYLKAVAAAGTDDGPTVAAKMRELPVEDFFAKRGVVRKDGRMVHDMYLMEAKKPAESKGEWDLNKLIATVPGEQAFRPMAEGGCPLVGG
jgi:branched-chain amino acid transport system substrate-binding protein